MKIYETMDGKGGWTGTYARVGRPNIIISRFYPGQCLWVPVKKRLWWWVRDRSKKQFYDWSNMFREKEK